MACVRAWRTGGYEAAREAFLPYLPLVNFEQQARIALAVRKECLRRRGLIADAGVRAPAAPFPEASPGMPRSCERRAPRPDAGALARGVR